MGRVRTRDLGYCRVSIAIVALLVTMVVSGALVGANLGREMGDVFRVVSANSSLERGGTTEPPIFTSSKGLWATPILTPESPRGATQTVTLESPRGATQTVTPESPRGATQTVTLESPRGATQTVTPESPRGATQTVTPQRPRGATPPPTLNSLHRSNGANMTSAITIGKYGREPGSFNFNRGVVVSARSEIFVTDFNNHRIQVFNMKGVYLRLFPTVVPGRGGKTMRPYDVAIDGDGYLWVVGTYCYEVHVVQCSYDGRPETTFRAGSSEWPTSIAVDVRNRKIVVTVSPNIHVFHPNGSLHQSFRNVKGCTLSFVASNNDGRIFVTDRTHSFLEYNLSGNLLSKFTSAHLGQGRKLCYPKGLFVDASGHIIVANQFKHRVDMFTSQGRFIRTVVTNTTYPYGIAAGPGGELVGIAFGYTYDLFSKQRLEGKIVTPLTIIPTNLCLESSGTGVRGEVQVDRFGSSRRPPTGLAAPGPHLTRSPSGTVPRPADCPLPRSGSRVRKVKHYLAGTGSMACQDSNPGPLGSESSTLSLRHTTPQGQHYWYKFRPDMNCDDFYPVFLMYNDGKLNGFGWNINTVLDSPRYESPPTGALSLFFAQKPPCFDEHVRRGLSTLHIYLDDSPSSNFC
ncbi:hypothetical protein Bbelb_378510 [Branchiostoma belcheri]|nr:hypothetical protein Bbelb_378510 [Branchiostoma belcheri]